MVYFELVEWLYANNGMVGMCFPALWLDFLYSSGNAFITDPFSTKLEPEPLHSAWGSLTHLIFAADFSRTDLDILSDSTIPKDI